MKNQASGDACNDSRKRALKHLTAIILVRSMANAELGILAMEMIATTSERSLRVVVVVKHGQ